jgi:hypothetical protein
LEEKKIKKKKIILLSFRVNDKGKYGGTESQKKKEIILFSFGVNGWREVWEEGKTNKKENNIIFTRGE